MEKETIDHPSTLDEMLQGRGFTLFMFMFAGRLTRDRMIQTLKPIGLQPSHLHMLIHLLVLGPLPQSVVTQELGATSRVNIDVVDDLENWHYIKRIQDSEDPHQEHFTVTQKGTDKAIEAASMSDELVKEILGPLDERDMVSLRNALTSILKNQHVI